MELSVPSSQAVARARNLLKIEDRRAFQGFAWLSA